MSVTVREIRDRVADVLLEPGGFVLGLITDDQFLSTLAVVLLDFSQRAALDKNIFTEMISADVSEYIVPEDVMAPEICFVGGRLIEKVSESDLRRARSEWRKERGAPRQWHEDNLEIKRIELYPKPDFNGANIEGSAEPIGTYGDFNPADRNLTIVGTAAPSKTAWAMGDTLDGLPDSFGPYLVYGILAQVFSGESELRDMQRALYCRTRFEEAVLLSEAIAREDLMAEDD